MKDFKKDEGGKTAVMQARGKDNPAGGGLSISFDRVREHIVPVLLSAKGNDGFLEDAPHREWLDMALALQMRYSVGDECEAVVWVTGEHARTWGVPEETLFDKAMENAVRDHPPVLKGMSEVLARLAGDEQAGLTGNGQAQTATPMLVLSNREFSYGAAVLAYPGEVDELAARFPKGFYMLPSSIHELIIVPARDGGESLPSYTKMVREVNSTSVDPGEQLSSHAYYYDAGEGRFVF